jgi:hypothetical protein
MARWLTNAAFASAAFMSQFKIIQDSGVEHYEMAHAVPTQ